VESRLKRGLFGFSRKSVDAVVNDRDISIVKASREAEEAKAQLATVSAELGDRRIEIADLQARSRDLESKLEDAAGRLRAVERSGSNTTPEGMTDVLEAAELALARLTGEARRNAERQLGEIEQVRDSLRTEIDLLTEWRARMGPLAESVPDSIEDAREEMSAVWERLREALAPTKGALDALAARLSELAEVPEVPSRVEPPGGEVVSLGEAGEEAEGETTDAGLGLSAPSDRQAPSSPG
jgi:chromosome segregation ATPase